jgi:hypothetical protein
MPTLEPLPAGGWEALRSLDVDEWLWLDMEAPGIHLATTLPERAPAQTSHVWGWSAESLVRARVDLDLPGGVVGAILRLDTEQGGELVDVRQADGRRWAPGDGRVRVSYPEALKDRARGLTLYDVTRTTVTESGRTSMMPLEFVRLEEGLATRSGSAP